MDWKGPRFWISVDDFLGEAADLRFGEAAVAVPLREVAAERVVDRLEGGAIAGEVAAEGGVIASGGRSGRHP